jgi:hypothetical protein
MFYNVSVLEKMTQDRLDAALVAKMTEMEIADCRQSLKRG